MIMKKLVYKINKVDENCNPELITKGSKSKIMTKWDKIDPDGNHELSVGWELNGKSLGITLLESK